MVQRGGDSRLKTRKIDGVGAGGDDHQPTKELVMDAGVRVEIARSPGQEPAGVSLGHQVPAAGTPLSRGIDGDKDG